MSTAYEIFYNVLSEFIALALLAAFGYLMIIWRGRIWKVIIMLTQVFSKKRIFFYLDRRIQGKALGSIGKYIGNAKQELIYIGFWLSSSSNGLTDFSQSLEDMLDTGVLFKVFLLNPDNEQLIKGYSEYFDITQDELKKNIEKSITKITEIKERVKHKDCVQIYYHNSILQASCFIFDKSTQHCKVLLDHKHISETRAYSYGFEFDNNKSDIQKIILRVFDKVMKNAIRIK